MSVFRLAIVFVLGSLLSRPLAAEKPTPGEIFRRAQVAYDAKRYQEAGELFEHAFRLSPTAQAVYNAGIAWDDAGQRARAANSLTRAVNFRELSKQELDEASRRLATLVPTLGRLVFASPKGATVRVGEERANVPGALYVEPGTHTVEAKLAGGGTERESIAIGAGEARTLTFDPSGQPAPVTREVAPEVAKPKARGSSSSTVRILGYTALGVGVLAVGTGVVLNLRGIRENDDYEASDRQDLNARDRALDFRTAAFVAYGAGVVLGGVGVALVLSGSGKRPEEAGSRLRVSARGVAYAVSF